MHLGIFAKTFPRPDLLETLDAIKARGLNHIQFNMSSMGLPTLPDRLDEGSCVWIAQMLSERGLTMAAIPGTFNMCDPRRSRIENNLRRLDVLAGACRWLDTRIITLCTGTLDREDLWRSNPGNVLRRTWDELVQMMQKAVAIADRHEVILAFEPEINNVVSSVMRARKLLDEVDSPWLKVVIDPANLLRPGDMIRLQEILDEAFDWLGPDIVLAHAKEPLMNDVDEQALKEATEAAFSTRARAAVRELMESTSSENISEFGQTALNSPSRELLGNPSFHFYYPYFSRLRRLNYSGAIVIHGLQEPEVDLRAALLRDTLKPFLEEGSTDVVPPE